jgi:pimeloyl-ACP methyl ester carboxylesterase
MERKALHAVAIALALGACGAQAQPLPSTSVTTTYHTIIVDGVNVFYREAGPTDAPSLLMLHGFPSSSNMFATLIPLLADRYHIVAPDYPGFGLSDAPPPSQYAYTFDHIAGTVDHLTDALGLTRYSLYLQDYGGPIGFRLALAHPDRVQAIIIQNAVASEDGLGPAWDERKAFWKDRAAYEQKVVPNFLSFATTKGRHLGSSPNIDRYDPNEWIDEFAHLSQPGQTQIQADLFYDYRTNVAAYPAWQAWMRQHQPPMLVVWGKYDPSFALGGALAYRRDVPNAEVHILDAGHFALDEKLDEIAGLIRGFPAQQNLKGP